jgi:uncharacterized lipoprotein NlpE involved in copper resistance
VRIQVLALALAAALGACVPRAEPPPDSAHNSRNALDWAGVYEGITPCADCPGIKTRLTLQRDGRFELSTQYLDRQPEPQTARGQFSWDAAGNTITLDAAGWGQQYRVGEGRLLQLNHDGSAPRWDAPHRVLTLQPSK